MKNYGERVGSEAHLMKRRARKMAEKVFSFLFQEYVLLETPTDRPPDYEEKVQGLMKQGDYWPIILGTHKAHPAAFPLIEEANYLAQICNPVLPEGTPQITGSLLLIANTVEEGQSEAIVEGLKLAKPIFKKFHTETALVLREKDAEGLSKDEKREYLMRLLGKLGSVVAAGQIPIIMPEGTVESGRQKPGGAPGEINGMVHLQPNSVALPTRMIGGRQGRIPLIILKGIEGENHIYNPITEKVTEEARETALRRALPFGKDLVPPIMNALVGDPITLPQIIDMYGDNGKLPPGLLEQLCGELLAQLVPPNERGVYAEPQLIDPVKGAPGRDTSDLFW